MALKLPDFIPAEALVKPEPPAVELPEETTVEKEKKDGKYKKVKVDNAASVMAASPSLASVLTAFTKERGNGFVLKAKEVPNCTRFRTGVFEVDLATGGGIPRGRITIIYGPESSGKTNLALNVVREVQKLGLKVVFVDLEGTFDPTWAVEFGIDLDLLIVLKPAYGEEAVDAVDAVLRTNDIGLVVVDSIAAVVPANEIAKSTETADMGTGAILMKRMVNKAVMALALQGRHNRFPALLLLNQTRYKIGVMFGDPETFPGGQTVRFLSSLTIRVSATNEVDAKIHPTIPSWKKTTFKIKKAKLAINQSNCEYSMAMVPMPDYGLGIGQTYSWNAVLAILRAESKLVKMHSGEYSLLALPDPHKKVWSKLSEIEDRYLTDPDFAEAVQAVAISTFDGKGVMVEAHDAAK